MRLSLKQLYVGSIPTRVTNLKEKYYEADYLAYLVGCIQATLIPYVV